MNPKNSQISQTNQNNMHIHYTSTCYMLHNITLATSHSLYLYYPHAYSPFMYPHSPCRVVGNPNSNPITSFCLSRPPSAVLYSPQSTYATVPRQHTTLTYYITHEAEYAVIYSQHDWVEAVPWKPLVIPTDHLQFNFYNQILRH